jgi:hypothetical protein
LIFPVKELLPFGGFYVPSCGGSQLISIPPMHVVFQTAVRCGGNHLIVRETRVANLGTYENQDIFSGILKIDFSKVVLIKYRYMRFSGPKQNSHPYFSSYFQKVHLYFWMIFGDFLDKLLKKNLI